VLIGQDLQDPLAQTIVSAGGLGSVGERRYITHPVDDASLGAFGLQVDAVGLRGDQPGRVGLAINQGGFDRETPDTLLSNYTGAGLVADVVSPVDYGY
jgi:hypothetical protein